MQNKRSSTSRMRVLPRILLACLGFADIGLGQAVHWSLSGKIERAEKFLSEAKIPAKERAAIVKAILAEYRGDPIEEKDALDARVRFVDLNGDGVPEVIVQGPSALCSPTGNCAFLVLKKTPQGYKRIFRRGAVQTFAISKHRTNGYLDLTIGMHGSAFEQTFRVVQRTARGYELTACYDVRFRSSDDPDAEQKTIVTRCQ